MGTKTASATTAVQQFPHGTASPGVYYYEVLQGTTIVQQFQRVDTGPFTLTLADGTYTLRVYRKKTDGTVLGTPAESAPFTIVTPTESIPVPVSVSVG